MIFTFTSNSFSSSWLIPWTLLILKDSKNMKAEKKNYSAWVTWRFKIPGKETNSENRRSVTGFLYFFSIIQRFQNVSKLHLINTTRKIYRVTMFLNSKSFEEKKILFSKDKLELCKIIWPLIIFLSINKVKNKQMRWYFTAVAKYRNMKICKNETFECQWTLYDCRITMQERQLFIVFIFLNEHHFWAVHCQYEQLLILGKFC